MNKKTSLLPESTDSSRITIQKGVTVTEAARLLGVSERTIYRYVKNGKLMSDKMSGKMRVYLSDSVHDYQFMSDNLSEKCDELDEKFQSLNTAVEHLANEYHLLRQQMDHTYQLVASLLQGNQNLLQNLVELLRETQETLSRIHSTEAHRGRDKQGIFLFCHKLLARNRDKDRETR